MLVGLASDGDATPLELDDVDGSAVEVGVGGDEVKTEFESELLGLENVRRLLGEDVDGVPARGRALAGRNMEEAGENRT